MVFTAGQVISIEPTSVHPAARRLGMSHADAKELMCLQLERELELHRNGMDGMNTSSTDYENARRALDEHTRAHDHHSRSA